MEQRELHHERDDIRAFYSQFSGEVIVGIEACGYTNWFEELIGRAVVERAGQPGCAGDEVTDASGSGFVDLALPGAHPGRSDSLLLHAEGGSRFIT
jgi:hypothetical protein